MMEHQHITNISSTSWSVTSVQTQNVILLVPLLGTEKNFLTENNGDPLHTKQVGKKSIDELSKTEKPGPER